MSFRNSIILFIVLAVSCLLNTAHASSGYVGRIDGELTVSPLGQALYEIPLTAIPGTGGMVPHLSISYNSSTKSGLFGYGFDLTGLSIIGRSPQNIALDGRAGEITFSTEDRFTLDGSRLICTDTINAYEHVYSTEIKTYARIKSYGSAGNPETFTVETKSGITYEYKANTRILQPSSTIPGLFWMLTRATDTQGNYFTVIYDGDNTCNEIYPTRIDYTGNEAAGLTPYASVRLSYEDRPDTAFTYLHGHIVRHLKCVSSIGLYYGNSKVREYRMDYCIQNNHKLLSSVTEISSNGTEKNPTSFQWKTIDNYSPNVGSIRNNVSLYHVSLSVGDFNGDGKSDFMAIPDDDSAPQDSWLLYTKLSNGFYESVIPHTSGVVPKQVEIADFDGDGKQDFAVVSRYSGSDDKVCIYRSSQLDVRPPMICEYPKGFSIYPVEIDGDGASELLVTHPNGQYAIFKWSVRASGLFLFENAYYGSCSQKWDKLVCTDVNGDGLTDLVNLRSSNSRLMVANGQGGFTESSFGYGTDQELLFGDFNADGREDYLYCSHNGTPLTSWLLFGSSGDGTFRLLDRISPPYNDPSNVNTYVADINSDGYADLLTINKTGAGMLRTYLNDCHGHFIAQSSCNVGYATDKWRYYSGDFTGDGKLDFLCTGDYVHGTWRGYKLISMPNGENMLLGSITDGLGNTTAIEYKYMSDETVHSRGNSFDLNINSFSTSWPLVYQVKTPDGIGGQHSVTYKYANALFHRKGRGVLGFSKVTVTDDETNKSSVTTYAPSANRHVMDPIRVETYIGNHLLSRTDTWYMAAPDGHMPISHLPDSVVEKIYDPFFNFLISNKTTVNSYDEYGNLVRSELHDDDVSMLTENTYDNNVDNWHLGRLTSSRVTKQRAGDTKIHCAQFEYDSTTGLLTAEVSEPENATLGYRKTYVHDVFGNITSSTTTPLDVNCTARTDSTVYDGKGRFIVQQINSLGQTITNNIDEYDGLLNWTEDANGLHTSYGYDPFGRNVAVNTSISCSTTATGWSLGHPDAPSAALYYTLTETTGQPSSLIFYDCLGRAVRTVTENAFGQKIYSDVFYNAAGQIIKTSEPYFQGDMPLWNISTYDQAGRLSSQIDPEDNASYYHYNGFVTTVTDPLYHQTSRETDSHGNLVKSTDQDGNSVEYEYDVEGHCVKVSGPRTTITMEYDLRGNRTLLDDPDLGMVTSVYNAYGELISQTDSKGTTTYQYDKLGRLVSEIRPDVTYTTVYDTRFVGAVTSVSASNSSSTQYFYDENGRVIRQSYGYGGSWLSVSTSYDSHNRLSKTTYPNGFAVDYDYSANHHLTAVKDHSNQSVIWQLTQQDARGNATQEAFGNGLVTTNTYDAATGRLSAISTPGIQNWTYTYDVLGNLTQRKDVSRNLTEDFSYDALDRLIEIRKNGQVVQQSVYDAAGNVLSRTGVGHEFTYAEGTNRLKDFYADQPYVKPWDDIQYTSFHKVSRIRSGNEVLELTYGPEKSRGRAVRKSNGTVTETKYYVGGIYEQSYANGTTTYTCYVYAGGKAVAIRETKGSVIKMLYLHHDHLGSVVAYSNANGDIEQELSYDAWGRRRDPSTWDYYDSASAATPLNPWGFSGHEHIDVFEMVNMDGRIYDPMTGRFLSPDPFVQAPEFTQSLNRYIYCINNPLSLTDPTGYSWLGDNWRSLVASAIGIAVSAITAGTGATFAVAVIAGAAGGAAGALTGALLNGANLGQMAKATLTGAFWGGVSGALNFMSADEDLIAKIFKHTFTQGLLEGIQGGNAIHGMMMGAVSGAGGHFINKYQTTLGRAGEIAASAVLGGTVDEIGGGKFANGAITSAFSTMFNDMMHPQDGNDEKKGFALNAEIEEHGGCFYIRGLDGNLHIVGERGLELSHLDFDLICVFSGVSCGVVDGTKALYSSFIKYTGGRKAWFRIGPSKSTTGNFLTKKSFRWGSNSHYRKKIGSPTLRRWNEQIHNTKLPGNNWRVNDSGHFHIKKK